MPAAEEQQLVVEARSGSQSAFRVLVERHMKQAYNIAYGFLNDHDGAEDIAQEAFVRAYESLHTFRGEAEFSTWLSRIVMNLSLNRVKKIRRRHEFEVRALDAGASPASVNPGDDHEQDLTAHIERALHELPTLQRATVILRHLEGLSTQQVSRILGCSEGTVKTHLYRGLMKLKKKLRFLNEEL